MVGVSYFKNEVNVFVRLDRRNQTAERDEFSNFPSIPTVPRVAQYDHGSSSPNGRYCVYFHVLSSHVLWPRSVCDENKRAEIGFVQFILFGNATFRAVCDARRFDGDSRNNNNDGRKFSPFSRRTLIIINYSGRHWPRIVRTGFLRVDMSSMFDFRVPSHPRESPLNRTPF